MLSRRALLSGGSVLGAGWVVGCGSSPATTPATSPSPTGESSPLPAPSTSAGDAVLLAFFSRAGENYDNGGRRDLEVGNTEVLAQLIAELVGPDRVRLHKIEPAEPYSNSYDDTVARNVTEQNDDARPGIANPLASIDGYDTVLLASPIWNVRAPMIMSTFTDAYDFTGTTVLPVVTYAVSGLGSVERDYALACPGARIGTGLAVRGEQVSEQRSQVQAWLQQVGLTTR